MNDTKSLLFVGGPLDGVYLDVKNDVKIYRAALPVTAFGMPYVEYRRIRLIDRLICGEKAVEHELMFLDDRYKGVIETLIAGYRTPMGYHSPYDDRIQ